MLLALSATELKVTFDRQVECRTVLTTGPLKDQDEVVAVSTSPQTKAHFKGSLTFGVAFGEPDLTIDKLNDVAAVVGRVIGQFEPAFQ